VYSQCVDPDQIVCRNSPEDGIWVVTGPGGRGMTLGPAIAEQTADLIGL
jgi:glycine/D-amino acid oxidase-like deaminating enzyme